MRASRGAWFVAGVVTALILTVGGAFAATGGTFILGKANSAGAESRLANSNGTPLALTAKPGTPPLRVNSGVKVAKLNSDRLDSLDATALQRRVSGTCAAGSAVRVVKAGGGVTCQPTADPVQSLGELEGLPCTSPDGAGTTEVVVGARTASGNGEWTYPVSTVCSVPWLPDGTQCDDGDPNTTDDHYIGGDCEGTPPDCDDGNPYTVDTFVVTDDVSSCMNDSQPMDFDNDTFTAEQQFDGSPDCNDADPAINPMAAEVAANAVDDDCDGTVDET